MKKPKLIAIDIDGTLLNNKGELTERTVRILRAAIEDGMKVMLATGRMCCSGIPYAKKVGMNIPCVFYNGAMISDPVTNEIIFRLELDEKDVNRVLKFYHKKNWYIQKYVNDTLYVVDNSDERTNYYISIAKVPAVSLGEKFWTEKTTSTKLLGCAKCSEDYCEMVETTIAEFGKEFYVAPSWNRFVEIINPKVNKAKAIEKVAAMYGITREDVACFGDSANDLEMIQWAGIGVAMGNAKKNIKAVADIVAPDNDSDGLAQIVERFL